MGLPRKRTSTKASKVVPTTQKKQRTNNSSVTPISPGQELIEEKSLYTVQCKTESERREVCGVTAEPGDQSDPHRINGDTSDWASVSLVKDIEVQCNNLDKPYSIKEEPQEVDIGQNTNQEYSFSPSFKVEPHEPFQENKKVKSYTCFCGKSYTCNSHLNRHRKIHVSEDQLLSGGNYNSRIVEEKTTARSFICRCGKQYTRNSNLKRHQNNCNEQAPRKTTVSAVIYPKVEVQEEKIKPYVCACGKSYTSSSHLYRHQRSHQEAKAQTERRYICDCGKTYSCSSHLYRHQRTHTEERVLRGRRVEEDPENLEQRVKPYVCFCGKRYTCSSHLYRHQKIHQVEKSPPAKTPVVEDNEPEKRYKCECGKSYSSSSHLYRHQRTHAEQDLTVDSNDVDHDSEDFEYEDCRQKPYMCECGKSFILSFSLLLHKKIHCQWKHTTDCDPADQ